MDKRKQIASFFIFAVSASLFAVILFLWPQDEKKELENTTTIPHKDAIEQEGSFKPSNIVENININTVSIKPDQNDDLDATTEQLINQSTTEIAKETNALIKHPIHEGRKQIIDEIKVENFEECFMNTTTTDNIFMLFSSFGSTMFSPGFYDSDVIMIRSMTRARRLMELAKENPDENARFLENQINEIGSNYDLHRSEFLKLARSNSLPVIIKELNQFQQDTIHLTIAIYLLSEINAYQSLPAMLNLSKSGNVRRQNWGDDAFYPDNENFPVNPQFLIYSMHRLVVNYPENLLSEQALQARTEYLKKADELHVSLPRTVSVATWDSPYKEDDYRLRLPQLKREMNVSFQKKMYLTVYPLSVYRLSRDDVNMLLDKLENFCVMSSLDVL